MPSPKAERVQRILALAVDYDRTLTDLDLLPVPRAIEALQRAKDAGARIVVVSGRDLEFLERALGGIADAIVAENGAFLLLPGLEARRLGPEVDVHGALATLGVPVERGRVLVSAEVEHEPLLREALGAAGIDAQLIRNRDRVMVLPRGVDKAMGVLAALQALGIDPERAAAAGDGENDVVMLNAVGYGIAVENAVDELKDVASFVTDAPGGEGLANWVEQEWLPRLVMPA